VLNAEGAVLLLTDSSHTALVPHEPSLYGTVREWPLKRWPLDGPGHQVEVFHTGQPYISNDPPTSIELPRRNVMTVPLNTRQETLGVLSVINRHEGLFTSSQCDLAIAIASQIAVSLASAQLFIRERQRADLMQVINRVTQEFTALLDMRGLLRTVAQNVHYHLKYDAVYIYQMDDESQMMTCHACAVSNPLNLLETGREIPIGQHIMFNRVLDSQRTLILNRIDPSTSEPHLKNLSNCMIVPLKRGSRIFGFIEIWTAADGEFGENEKAAIENLASQVSTAVDNAWLYNQAQQRLLEQGIVHQIGQDLTSILDYNELVSAVARHMARALDTSRCIVATYNVPQNVIQVEADFLQRAYHPARKTLEINTKYPVMNNTALQHALDTHRAVDIYLDDEGTPQEQRKQLQQDDVFSQLI
ncbi:MAG: GAF domain-containing protein, partial [Anaerolineae bacterium]|nr:GAF domain-containing protein [Anaerolineae bacterium]